MPALRRRRFGCRRFGLNRDPLIADFHEIKGTDFLETALRRAADSVDRCLWKSVRFIGENLC